MKAAHRSSNGYFVLVWSKVPSKYMWLLSGIGGQLWQRPQTLVFWARKEESLTLGEWRSCSFSFLWARICLILEDTNAIIIHSAACTPITIFLWSIGLIVYFGLPNYYRQTPGKVPSFYKSVFRRKIVLWNWVVIILQNFFLSAPYGRNWNCKSSINSY